MTAWPDFYTHSFLAVGIVNGEVVRHLAVYCCHGYNLHVAIRLIPHWSFHCDQGNVVLYFNSHHWWPEASYKTVQNRTISHIIDREYDNNNFCFTFKVSSFKKMCNFTEIKPVEVQKPALC